MYLVYDLSHHFRCSLRHAIFWFSQSAVCSLTGRPAGGVLNGFPSLYRPPFCSVRQLSQADTQQRPHFVVPVRSNRIDLAPAIEARAAWGPPAAVRKRAGPLVGTLSFLFFASLAPIVFSQVGRAELI